MKKKTSRKLEPCPFCGSTDVSLHFDDITFSVYYVFCDNCYAEGGYRAHRVDAVKAWNNRA